MAKMIPPINHHYDGKDYGDGGYPSSGGNTSNSPRFELQPFKKESPQTVIDDI